jgi:hypothetical protein
MTSPPDAVPIPAAPEMPRRRSGVVQSSLDLVFSCMSSFKIYDFVADRQTPVHSRCDMARQPVLLHPSSTPPPALNPPPATTGPSVGVGTTQAQQTKKMQKRMKISSKKTWMRETKWTSRRRRKAGPAIYRACLITGMSGSLRISRRAYRPLRLSRLLRWAYRLILPREGRTARGRRRFWGARPARGRSTRSERGCLLQARQGRDSTLAGKTSLRLHLTRKRS